MTDQVKDPRRKVIYARDADLPLFDDAAAVAEALGVKLSVVVADALRAWPTLIAWQAGRDHTAPQ
jgi:hypothetical protein